MMRVYDDMPIDISLRKMVFSTNAATVAMVIGTERLRRGGIPSGSWRAKMITATMASP